MNNNVANNNEIHNLILLYSLIRLRITINYCNHIMNDHFDKLSISSLHPLYHYIIFDAYNGQAIYMIKDRVGIMFMIHTM